MHQIFHQLYIWIVRNKISAGVALLFFIAGSIFFASKITFNEDIQKIIPKNKAYELKGKLLSQLDFSDKIIITIEAKNDEISLPEIAEDFLSDAQKISPWIQSISGEISQEKMAQTYNFVQKNLPLFLDKDNYKTLENKIKTDSITQKLDDNISQLMSPSSIITKDFIEKDPLGFSLLGLKKISKPDENFTIIDGFLHTKNGKEILLFLTPKFSGSDTEHNTILAQKLAEIEKNFNKKYKNKAEISSFGAPLIAVANAQQIKEDIQRTVVFSTAVLFLLLIIYFRNIWAPILIFIPTLLGALGGLATVYFFRKEISAISLSVSAILIGITIDYAIHILTHYKNKGDIKEVFKDITQPIMMSASTTGISFLCLLFVRSEALKDLGIFACATVLLSAIFTLMIIPILYTPKSGAKRGKSLLDKLGDFPYEEKKWLRWACIFIVVMSFFGFQKLHFNNNLSDLNFIPRELKENEKKLSKISDITEKSLYIITYGKSEEQILAQNQKIAASLQKEKKIGKIINFNTSGNIIAPTKIQKEKIQQWKRFWTEEKRQKTIGTLMQKGKEMGYDTEAFLHFNETLNGDYSPLSAKDFNELESIKDGGFIKEKDGLFTATSIVKIDEKNRNYFLKKFENENTVVIDRQQMNEDFLALLEEDFSTLVNYSVLVIVLIFYLFFRNIDLTIIAVVPILISGIVTAGLLYFLGLELNIFSTIVCSLIFGAGVDFNIFLTQAMQKELTTGERQLPLYRVSIILALLTTVLAIGVLVFAKHPALYSVSSVAMVGLLAVTIISFSLYPLFFHFIKYRVAKGQSPVGFRLIFLSFFSFLYYGILATIFSALSPLWLKNASPKRILFAKKIMAKIVISVLRTNPFVTKRIFNPHSINFEKPSIIIANHTSFLDTLALGMVSHKFVYMVNDWVYHSPIFGKLVRTLGFFPASMGIENGIEHLKEKVEKGFSIVIFPEGQRSETNAIYRFHKGAFFLSEKLNLPIVPIYIHGNSEVLPKNDYITYDGAITVVVGEKIEPTDPRFGIGYKERTKTINRFFREEFSKIRSQWEDKKYFHKHILRSFLFKENDIISEVKKNLKQYGEKLYALNPYLPKEGKILHIGDHHGELDILLTLFEAKRKIFSYLLNSEKINIAQQNHYLKTRKIFYLESEENIPATEVWLLHSDIALPENAPLPEMIIFPKSNVKTYPPQGFVQKNTVVGYHIYEKEK